MYFYLEKVNLYSFPYGWPNKRTSMMHRVFNAILFELLVYADNKIP